MAVLVSLTPRGIAARPPRDKPILESFAFVLQLRCDTVLARMLDPVCDLSGSSGGGEAGFLWGDHALSG